MRDVCRLMGIVKTHTTPYHPQGNGLVERTNRTIKCILKAFVDQCRSDRWDEYLPQCMLAYRASIHSTTNYSPAFLRFGHELRMPIDLQTPLLPVQSVSLPAYLSGLHDRLATAYRIAKDCMTTAQSSQRFNYDRFARGPRYAVGDRDWLHHPNPKPGASTKLPRS